MPLIQDGEPFEDESADPSEPEQNDVESEEKLAFDPRHRQDFMGLLFLGGLTKTFDYAGHSFTIRSLRTEEILALGLLVKDHDKSATQLKAYATGVVGAALVSVDGKPFEVPYREESAAENLRFRFEKVGAWYPQVIDVIYSEYLVLEERVNEVFESMGKA